MNARDHDDTAEWAMVWAAPAGVLFFLLIVVFVVGMWKISHLHKHELLK